MLLGLFQQVAKLHTGNVHIRYQKLKTEQASNRYFIKHILFVHDVHVANIPNNNNKTDYRSIEVQVMIKRNSWITSR